MGGRIQGRRAMYAVTKIGAQGRDGGGGDHPRMLSSGLCRSRAKKRSPRTVKTTFTGWIFQQGVYGGRGDRPRHWAVDGEKAGGTVGKGLGA